MRQLFQCLGIENGNSRSGMLNDRFVGQLSEHTRKRFGLGANHLSHFGSLQWHGHRPRLVGRIRQGSVEPLEQAGGALEGRIGSQFNQSVLAGPKLVGQLGH